MICTPVESKTTWDTLFNTWGSPSFLHSWEWGALQEKNGYTVMRLAIGNDASNPLAIALVLKIRAKRGNMLFIPHGPVVQPGLSKDDEMKVIVCIKSYLSDIAKKEGFAFIRIASLFDDTPEYRALFKNLGFRTSPIYMHAERVWALDITPSEDELLKNMRKTTRYSIRKAEKEGVTIEERTDEKAIDDFWGVYDETAKRESFTPFSKQFIQDEFRTFHNANNALFLFGKFEGKYVACALVTLTTSSAFYHQGASLHTKMPVPYLLQWRAICEAKKRGCKTYSFWGILQPGRSPKAWGGLTLFKKGFGGYQHDYLPTQDLVINPVQYAVSFVYEHYLKYKRGV